MKIDATEKKELLESLDKLRSFIDRLETKKGCISCFNWSGDNGIDGRGGCKISNDLTPPVKVIENGCIKWEIFDTIPF